MYTLLILFALMAVLLSFMCSLWEAVLLSITPSYAETQAQAGSKIGARLKSFKENIDRPLAAILTLNTIAHTVGAIGVGEQAGAIWNETNPIVTSVVVPGLMTLVVLVLSEIIPKTIGANFWRELAPFTVRSLTIIMILLAPLVWMGQFITQALKRDKDKSVLSRSDFVAMAQIGAREGVLEESESQIIGNLVRFNTIRTKDIMTPRTVVKAAKEETTLRAFYEAHHELQFSRVPTYKGDDREHITGFFLKDDMLEKLVDDEDDATIGSIRRDIMLVSDDARIPVVFNKFIENRQHIGVVVGEFGGMRGIITMEDVIETLLGLEIVDEFDNAEDMQILARQNWEKRAKVLGLLLKDDGADVAEEVEPDAGD